MNNYNKTPGHHILNKRYTEYTVFTRHRTNTNKIRDTTQETKKMSNTDPSKTGGELDIGGNLSS